MPKRRHERPPAARRCPDCGYDLAGLTLRACPECGLHVWDMGDIAAMKRRARDRREVLTAILLTVLIVAVIASLTMAALVLL